MNNVIYQHGLMGLTTPGEWVRPVDWLPMPATVANSIDILAAVFNHDSNYCAVKISVSSGTYNVDWGDGTTSTGVASNVQADHVYTYSALAGTESAKGYRQALIRITPATGSITAVNLNVKHARSGLVNGVASPWLDIAVNAPSATSLSFYSNATCCNLLERLSVLAIGTVTILWTAFANCYSLQSISFPAGSLSAVTNFSQAFYKCYSLQSISFPAGSLSAVTDLSLAFYNCYSLRSVSFPAGSLSAVTNLSYAFANCYSLRSVSFPAGSLSAVTNLSYAFYNCYSPQSISFPAGSLSAVTTLSYAFANCYSLQSIDLPNSFSTSAAVDTTNAFAAGVSLSSISNLKVYNTFSVTGCRLSGVALNAIFTALPTVTGKTITVTGNHGIPDSTPSIATAKGWTVIT